MSDKIQIKRGSKPNMPTLSDGELAYCKDTQQLYIGNEGAADEVGPSTVSLGTSTSLNGLLKGDGTAVNTAVPGVDYVAGNDYARIASGTTTLGTGGHPGSEVFDFTLDPPLTAYTKGMLLIVDFHKDGQDAYLNVDGLGEKYIFPLDTDNHFRPFSAGLHTLIYDGTFIRMLDTSFVSGSGGSIDGDLIPYHDHMYSLGSVSSFWHEICGDTGVFKELLVDDCFVRDSVFEQDTWQDTWPSPSFTWTYRKWSSGVKECWAVFTCSVNIDSEYAGFYTTYPAKEFLLPFTLEDSDSAVISVSSSSMTFASDCSISGDTLSVSVGSAISRSDTVTLRIHVIGR